MSESQARTAFVEGARSVLPLLLGVAPFGLIVGVSASTATMGTIPAMATSVVIFGGAAQLTTIELTNTGTAALVVILTGLVINARHFMYSASLAEHFRTFPAGWRYGLPYLMTDQAYAMSIIRYATTDDPVYKRWYFFGAGMCLWAPWQLTTLVGVLIGAQIPAEWSLDFVIPLGFMVLLITAVKNRPGVLAALVGAFVAVAGQRLPYNTALLVATAAGIVAGVVAERRLGRTTAGAP